MLKLNVNIHYASAEVCFINCWNHGVLFWTGARRFLHLRLTFSLWF